MNRKPARPQPTSTIRVGPLRLTLGVGLGCLSLTIIFVLIYALTALFFGWGFMLIHGAIVGHGMGAGYWTQPWGYWRSVVPWGLVAPLVFGRGGSS